MTTARDRAEAWLAVDPDPATGAELRDLLAAGDDEELERRFSGRLSFGTAGLRGPLGAGPTRMNRVLVRLTAAALGDVLAARGHDGGTVVVGHDARHGSADFAADSARVLAARGFAVVAVEGPSPTPVVAFAVRRESAVAGVQVTASHNPPADNGYKVYWGDGAQIVEPIDVEVSAAMDRLGLVGEDELASPDDPRIVRRGTELVDEYLSAVLDAGSGERGRLRVVYSALHGVGGATLLELWRRAGLDPPVVVAEQFEPDPEFPTVPFPNPEEPGAMDLSLATAAEAGADLVLAHDPDADRLAVAVPGADGWRVLSGNEVGWLLADHRLASTDGPGRVVATSVVSSRMLDRIAAEHGARSERTLTGFKWIVRPALEDPSSRWVFGYEEALGYLVNDVVWDKDGISAALAMTELALAEAERGRTLLDRLDDLARRHGLHVTRSWSMRRPDAAAAAQVFRDDPPDRLGTEDVVDVEDRPDAGLIVLSTATSWLAVRPSGTEPKLKFYAETVVDDVGDDLAAARTTAAARLDAIQTPN